MSRTRTDNASLFYPTSLSDKTLCLCYQQLCDGTAPPFLWGLPYQNWKALSNVLVTGADVVSLVAVTSVLCTALLRFITELRLLPHTGEITPQWMFVRGRVFMVHNCRRHTFRAHAEIMSSRTWMISIPLCDSENRIVLKLRKSFHGRSFWYLALQSGSVFIIAGT